MEYIIANNVTVKPILELSAITQVVISINCFSLSETDGVKGSIKQQLCVTWNFNTQLSPNRSRENVVGKLSIQSRESWRWIIVGTLYLKLVIIGAN